MKTCFKIFIISTCLGAASLTAGEIAITSAPISDGEPRLKITHSFDDESRQREHEGIANAELKGKFRRFDIDPAAGPVSVIRQDNASHPAARSTDKRSESDHLDFLIMEPPIFHDGPVNVLQLKPGE